MIFEKKLVTSFKDSMHLHHIITHGTNETIGYKLGRLARDYHKINKNDQVHSKSFAEHYGYLRETYPEHFARMAGFARAYGQSLTKSNTDFSFFGYPLGDIACSAVYYPPATTSSGRGYISRNLDFSIPKDFENPRPAFPFKHTYLLEMYPESCYPSISMFCFEVFGLALEGINSEGLCVIHLADADTRIDHPEMASGKTMKGFNEFLPIQYLLDRCADAQEALQALKQIEHYHLAVPVHLLVADRGGNSFIFEYAPDGSHKVFIQGRPDTPLKVTNFQINRLSDPSMIKVLESRAALNGLDRYRELEQRLDQVKFPISEQQIHNTNTSVYVHTPHKDSIELTLFHSIYDTSSCSVMFCLLPTMNSVKHLFYEFSFNRKSK